MINILAIYGKFLFIRPYKILSINLATNVKCLIAPLAFDNKIYVYVLLLEQNTIKKKQVDENITELDISDNESRKFKVEAIWDMVADI